MLDMNDIATLEVTAKEASMVAKVVSYPPIHLDGPWLASNPVIFGLGRLIGAHYHFWCGEAQTCVFYDRAEALKWSV
jgi:hypothetical protein